MVRFSDMLGGSGESDDASAADSPYAALASDAADPAADALEGDAEERSDTEPAKEPVPMSTFESPEAVLDRLTQYATSRPDPVAPAVESDATVPEPDPLEPDPLEPEPLEPRPESDDPLAPVGDDFLPSVRGLIRRPRRGRNRHP